MGARPTPPPGSTKGNFISEWFGHRVWPNVDDSQAARDDQTARNCPFLANATGKPTKCIKIPRGGTEPTGVCTVSSDSNKVRQEWLACPYRILDQKFTLLVEAVRTLYRVEDSVHVVVLPVTILQFEDQRKKAVDYTNAENCRIFLFAADKLGGEVDIPETKSSPGAKVDVSIVELLSVDPTNIENFKYGQHVIFEIQTADFHGSPLHAVALLQEICPAGTTDDYHEILRSKVEVCGTGMEGPNKANVFKRTIYQMVFKVRISTHEDFAGFVIILPLPVWTSWLRHLGFPKLPDDEMVVLAAPDEDKDKLRSESRAWIFVFDIDRESDSSPQPLRVVKKIATSENALLHHAFIAAADKGLEAGVVERFRKALGQRVSSNWNSGGQDKAT